MISIHRHRLPGGNFGPDYRHIYFSPHLDDAVLSCAGRIARQTSAGLAVLVVTIFAGCGRGGTRPPRAFAPFQDIAARRREDRRALAVVGADHLWLDFPDAIQRHRRYASLLGITAPIGRREAPLHAAVAAEVARICRRWPAARRYFPLAIGNHVDHQIVAAAGFDLLCTNSGPGHDIAFYEDTPYVCIPHLLRQRFEQIGIASPPGVPPAVTACAREAHAALMASPQLARHAGPVARRLLLAYLVVRFGRARLRAQRRRWLAMHPELTDIGDRFDTKVAAIACYDSQVAAIYGDHETMRRELAACCATARRGAKHERYWLPAEVTRATVSSKLPSLLHKCMTFRER